VGNVGGGGEFVGGVRTLSYGVRPALLEISRTPYGARPILQELSRAMMNTFILKFATIPPPKQIVKIRKIVADSDSDGEENHA